MPEAFGLARSSVARRFIRASARELRRLQERRLDDADWLVLVLDGKSFAGDELVLALGVTVTGEKRLLGLVQTATPDALQIAAAIGEGYATLVTTNDRALRSVPGLQVVQLAWHL